MDVDELMNLKRPLTDEETAFLEQNLLSLTRELGVEIRKLTANLDPADPVVAKLRDAPARITRNVESAIECRAAEKASHADEKKRGKADVVYSWEKLPVYAWNNELARVIGRLLVELPRRLHAPLHNLAGQATLISTCIALGHRDTAPGEVVPKEELRAYRTIGYHATFTTMELLEELSRVTRNGRRDIAQGMSLVGRIRDQFEADLAQLDDVHLESPATLH